MTQNGGYVTRAELNAHIGPMKEDIAEIKDDVKTLLRSRDGGYAVAGLMRWIVPVIASLGSSSLVAYLIAAH